MTIYSIGFTQKSAAAFFGAIKSNGIPLVLDIRLNNQSQLAGFSKGSDLDYFLDALCACQYVYDPIFAPTKALMEAMKSRSITLQQFRSDYIRLMEERNGFTHFMERYASFARICLLCSEDQPDQCHRTILAEWLQTQLPDIIIHHLSS